MPAFERAVYRLGNGADFIVLPDIVMGGADSLRFSLSWLPRLRGVAPLMLPVQDGMTFDAVADVIGESVGVFVGGSSAWKERTASRWGVVARAAGARLHVGRVNTARRIRLCSDAGADSFDGSSVSRFSVNLPRLERARRQVSLFHWA